MNRLREKFQKEIRPRLMKDLGYDNILAVPRLEKVVINVGTSQGLKDAKYNEGVEATLKRITGQRPVKTLARQSISNFKIRAGQTVGLMVTLRSGRMYDFLDKLINVTLPRVRDFRGLDPKNIDQSGNLNLGLKEHLAFPEIKSDEVEKIHGLQITVVTTAKNKTEGLALLRELGFPFSKDN